MKKRQENRLLKTVIDTSSKDGFVLETLTYEDHEEQWQHKEGHSSVLVYETNRLLETIIDTSSKDGFVLETLIYEDHEEQWQHKEGHASVIVYDTRD
jgi:hypothetical protein